MFWQLPADDPIVHLQDDLAFSKTFMLNVNIYMLLKLGLDNVQNMEMDFDGAFELKYDMMVDFSRIIQSTYC